MRANDVDKNCKVFEINTDCSFTRDCMSELRPRVVMQSEDGKSNPNSNTIWTLIDSDGYFDNSNLCMEGLKVFDLKSLSTEDRFENGRLGDVTCMCC